MARSRFITRIFIDFPKVQIYNFFWLITCLPAMGYDGLLSFRGFTGLPVRLDRFWPCGPMCFGLRVQDELQPCCAGRGSHCFVRLAVHRQGWPCIFSDRGRASLGQNLSCCWPFKNLAFQIIFQRTFLDFRFLTMNDNGPRLCCVPHSYLYVCWCSRFPNLQFLVLMSRMCGMQYRCC